MISKRIITALMRDDRKPVIVGKQSIGKPKIYIYSSAGALLQMIVVSYQLNR